MNNSFPKISIVTATFNSEATIRDTLESILNQSYQNYEVIIEDGISKDNTLKIVGEYKEKLGERLAIFSERDKGIYDAMNKGISHATGDIIGILNSDDFYDNTEVLKNIANTFQNSPDIECVYGDLVFVDANNTSVIKRTWKGSSYPKKGFITGWHPAHPTFYAKRDCYERYGCFDITFDVSADFELMLRFLEKNHAKNQYIETVFVKMRLGGESTGSISKIIQGNKNVLKAFKKNGIPTPHFYIIKRLAPKAWNIIKSRFKH